MCHSSIEKISENEFFKQIGLPAGKFIELKHRKKLEDLMVEDAMLDMIELYCCESGQGYCYVTTGISDDSLKPHRHIISEGDTMQEALFSCVLALKSFGFLKNSRIQECFK